MQVSRILEVTDVVAGKSVLGIALDGFGKTSDTLGITKLGVLLAGEGTSGLLLLPHGLENVSRQIANAFGQKAYLLAGHEFVVNHSSVIESLGLVLIDLHLLSLSIGTESGKSAEKKSRLDHRGGALGVCGRERWNG